MGYPPPSTSSEKPALTRVDPPGGPLMHPRATEAQLLYLDGQWRPATVLAWHRLDVARRQPITEQGIFWLVHLRLPRGEEGWFEFYTATRAPPPLASTRGR